MPTQPYATRRGRRKHRAVVEAIIGRPLRPDEIVHHRDGNKRNNHPSNLVVMSRAEHARLHVEENLRRKYQKRARRGLLVTLSCAWRRVGALDAGGLLLIEMLAAAEAATDIAAWRARRPYADAAA